MNSSFFINLNRCVNLTYDSYNSKDFLAKNYYSENHIISFNNIQETIENSILNIAGKLPLNKVPGPIYVLVARKLEYDGFKYGDCLDKIYQEIASSECFSDNYATISNHATLDDIKKSNVSKYSFKNNYEIFILYPNISSDLRYFLNYSTYIMTNQHVFNIIADPYLYQILNDEDKTNYYDKLNEFYDMSSTINPNSITSINNYITSRKKITAFSDYQRLNNTLCGLGGCASEFGEPLKNIFTPKDTPRNNYVPNKCLLQLNTRLYNNTDINYGLETITSNLLNINAIGNIYNSDNNDRYNNADEYDELNKRYVKYPGIQEIIFSAFKIKTDNNKNVLNMPWGNIILSNSYAITDLYPLLPGNFIYSANNNYRLLFNTLGQLYVHINNNGKWVSFKTLNDKIVKGLINLSIVDNSLTIKSTIIDINILPKTTINLPLTVILDNNGNLKMYGNYFES